MSTRRLTVTTMVAAAAVICAAYLNADDHSPETEATSPDQPRVDDVAALGYSTKLEFKVIHPEGAPTFFTHSCGGPFDISEDITEPNHEHTMQFEGILSRGDDDRRLLLQYDVQAFHSDLNEGFEAVHSASGSVLLTPGHTQTLTLLGDAPLQVTATRDE